MIELPGAVKVDPEAVCYNSREVGHGESKRCELSLFSLHEHALLAVQYVSDFLSRIALRAFAAATVQPPPHDRDVENDCGEDRD